MRNNRFFRPMLWPTVMTLAALPVLIGLGLWQVERLQWKEALLQRIDTRLNGEAAPMPAPGTWDAFDAEAEEYRRVKLTGRFLPREFHHFTQDEGGAAGYGIVSPLEVAEGAVVLVDRGFVPAALKEAHGGVPEGEVSFTGVLRAPQRRGPFDGQDDTQKNVWMVRDPARMGAALDGMKPAPFIVEAERGSFPGEWPKPKGTRVDIPNNHLDYALTWFGLAGVLAVIYIAYHRSNGRIGRERKKA
ncbi:SURF1 family protein [Parvibaculum sp.]|uniref:SURF1 family protein n=1 Tax=Parvibaculum sp. TaxID=2024848 RepID=UPI001B04B69E|nr:SURF1 family protein [Parvibaculum sp.]MBO6666932.1 SURF1 family protein [Parvibaculum sp.]MBO6690376.1 SURF1 family protein [Parvibaculum sp.]MBO6713553.1 SURF1 family protein [Parvibaculum sp.]